MNGHRGYDDRATAAPPITNPDPNERGGRGGGGEVMELEEKGLWTMGDTTTARHNFFWGGSVYLKRNQGTLRWAADGGV